MDFCIGSGKFSLPKFLVRIRENPVETKIVELCAGKALTLEEISGLLEMQFGESKNSNFVSIVLGELVSEGVLKKKSNTYSVSGEWLEKYGKFINSLYEKQVRPGKG